MLTIESASNPVYTSADYTSIDLVVKFVEFNEAIQFHATPSDVMPYGVELYSKAKADKFGTIAPYVPPPQPKTTVTKTA